jgi:maltose O-acetyltransferase
MNEREKMLAGMLYDPMDPELQDARVQARLKTEAFNLSSIANVKERIVMLRELFGKCGAVIYVEPPFHCDYGTNIRVGDNFYANFGCVILDVAEVTIGDNCLIAPQVGIYTATHPIDPAMRRSGKELAKPIAIGNDCWIGGHATINPGVTLGNNVVVASGAVVTKSFGDNIVLAGNPAKVLRRVE